MVDVQQEEQDVVLSRIVYEYLGDDARNGYPGGFDSLEDNQSGGREEQRRYKLLEEAIRQYNKSSRDNDKDNKDNKDILFNCLFELMKPSPKLFSYVLRSKGGKLNIDLIKIFTCHSKWYTEHIESSDYDIRRRNSEYDLELKRVLHCSQKKPVPSILFLEFLLFLCNKIAKIANEFYLTVSHVVSDMYNDTDPQKNAEIRGEISDAVDIDLKKGFHKSILCKLKILELSAHIPDSDGVLNMACPLHELEIITTESPDRVKEIKRHILDIYKKYAKRFNGMVTPASFSLGSAFAVLCAELIKYLIPSDASGHTGSPSLSPERSGQHIKVRDEYTQEILNSLYNPDEEYRKEALTGDEIISIAKSFGWCPFLFEDEGCYRRVGALDDGVPHRRIFNHPLNYESGSPCMFNVCDEKVLMMGKKRSRPPNQDDGHHGGKSLKKYRKNTKHFTRRRPSTNRRRHTRRRRTKRRRH